MRNMLDNLPDKPGCNCVPIAGRCPVCNEVITTGRETCQTCGWKVVESELRALQASEFSKEVRRPP
ncbi:MAG: hypothetical protein LUO79_05470 [Methanomassiliicoccales archaeon]|nr:hypothetical protein [Methanomassiliicoccales archaeon]